jgi:hypothetical protein
LQEVKLKTGVDAGAMLILQYLAYETIATLVDFAFVVRRDQRSSVALSVRQDAILAHGIPVRSAESNYFFSAVADVSP